MPFPMTHLYIAKRITEITPIPIANVNQFYLGAIAPDGVHFRNNFNGDYKRLSHLTPGDEKWGFVIDNDAWIKNVLDFFNNNEQCSDSDFRYGYCAHILSDIYNNVKIWIPFRLKYMQEVDENNIYGSKYHKESPLIDIQLYHSCQFKDELWNCLNRSKSVDLPPMVYADEIDRMKNSILNVQYTNSQETDTSQNEIITFENSLKFIDEATKFVIDKIFQHGHA